MPGHVGHQAKTMKHYVNQRNLKNYKNQSM